MKTTAFLLTLALLAAPVLRAQNDDDAMFAELGLLTTVGTTKAVNAEHWAWLLWQTDDAALLQNKTLAVYRKSGGNFARVSVTAAQPDARVIRALEPRAQMLGQDLVELDHGITTLFQSVIPAGTVTLAEKLSAAVRGTQNDAEKRASLAFLARSNPLVAMALGQGHADRLPAAGIYTYELREYDAAGDRDLRVLGRVTVNTAAGAALTAPGKPVEVTRDTEHRKEEHLAAHLRWATPDALRDRSTLLAGFHLYRVEKDYTEHASRQWHLTPPSVAALLAAPAGEVTRVNEPVITPEKSLSEAQALDANDHDTFFIVDDNRRFEAGQEPFLDGKAYYYFVTSVDILGRDSAVSAGTLVTLHDRLAPLPPKDVRVTNEVTFAANNRTQHLRVRWPRATDASSSIVEYHVFRWTSLEEIAQFRANPNARRIGIVPHHHATTEFILDDTGAGAPRLPPANGQPDVSGSLFFYTVKAVDASSGGGNVSAHSAPARGILRQAEGPGAPSGELVIRTHTPQTTFDGFYAKNEPGLPENMIHLKLACISTVEHAFEWAEFRVGAAEQLGRVYFERSHLLQNGTESRAAFLYLSRNEWPGILYCRVANRYGRISNWVPAPITTPSKSLNSRIIVEWLASQVSQNIPAGGPGGSTHFSVDPGSGARVPVVIGATPGDGTRELRLYRRVDDGPLTLLSTQVLGNDNDPITQEDLAVPAGAARVCYYAQGVDQDGVPSRLVFLGCIQVINDAELPVPRLLRPEPEEGPAGAPRMRLHWACAPHGVARFELWIARRANSPHTTFAGSGLSGNLAEGRVRHPQREGLEFGIYQTVVTNQVSTQENGAVFTALLPVSSSDEYEITVRAVGEGTYGGGRAAGAFSNFGSFLWNATEATGVSVNVPWPARPLPPARAAEAFHPGVEAVFLPNLGSGTAWKGVGIHVGEYEYRGENPDFVKASATGPANSMPRYFLPGQLDPKLLFYHETTPDDAPSKLLWPLVLYRVQLSATNQPVTGDTTQASPLMETIAHELTTAAGDPATLVHDPYVAVIPRQGAVFGSTHDIYVLDRNPVIKGARYQYLLVRMGADAEPEEVLATLPVTIPLNP